jgi:3-oxoadipate enol-lactonase
MANRSCRQQLVISGRPSKKTSLLRDRKITQAALVASSHGGEAALNFAFCYTAYVSDLVLVGAAATGFPYSEYCLMRQRENSQSDKVQHLMAASVRDRFLILPGQRCCP